MKYIVTGGAGFVGSHLVDQLISDGHEVHIIDNFSTGKKENCNNKAIYHELDISDTKLHTEFINIMKNGDGLFHCAASVNVQESIDNPVLYEKNNTIGTLNMLKCANDTNIKRFVYSSSCAVYGDTDQLPTKETNPVNPLSPYALQKYYGEIYCNMFSKIYDLETVSLRYFNIFGERQSINGSYATVIGIFLFQSINKQPMTIRGDGEQRRDFTYVKDIVSANILSMNSKNVGNGEIINVGTSTNYSVNQIAKIIGGPTINVEPVIEPRESLACIDKSKKLLNWEPKVNIIDWMPMYKNFLGLANE